MANKIKNLFEWNVISISYTAMRILIAFFIILILILSIGIYYYFTREPEEIRKARDQIQSINLQMSSIRKVDRNLYDQRDALEVRELYDNALEAYNEDKFSISMSYSSRALGILDRMNKDIALKLEPQRSLYATLSHIQGTVNVRRSGELEWTRASRNMKISKGDTIRTLMNSQAYISFEDGSKMHLHANSYLEIGDLWEDRATRRSQKRVSLSEPESKLDFSTESSHSEYIVQTPDIDTKIEGRASGHIDYISEDERSVIVYEGEATVTRTIEDAKRDYRVKRHTGLQYNLASDEANIIDLPDPVHLLSPIDKKIFPMTQDRSINTQWRDLNDYNRYIIEISTDSFFSNSIRKEVRNSKEALLTNLTEGNYFWRVFAINQEGINSPPSSRFNFRVIRDFDPISRDKPSLSIETPLTFGPFAIISGKTDSGILIFINEQRFDVRDDGHFQSTIRFDEGGSHEIDIIARNPRNDLETIKTVTVDIII